MHYLIDRVLQDSATHFISRILADAGGEEWRTATPPYPRSKSNRDKAAGVPVALPDAPPVADLLEKMVRPALSMVRAAVPLMAAERKERRTALLNAGASMDAMQRIMAPAATISAASVHHKIGESRAGAAGHSLLLSDGTKSPAGGKDSDGNVLTPFLRLAGCLAVNRAAAPVSVSGKNITAASLIEAAMPSGSRADRSANPAGSLSANDPMGVAGSATTGWPVGANHNTPFQQRGRMAGRDATHRAQSGIDAGWSAVPVAQSMTENAGPMQVVVMNGRDLADGVANYLTEQMDRPKGGLTGPDARISPWSMLT